MFDAVSEQKNNRKIEVSFFDVSIVRYGNRIGLAC
jgi:hypothetical protein